MAAALFFPQPTLDASQLQAALIDLFIYERVVVTDRAQAVQVYTTAVAHDIPVHLPRAGAGIWTVETAVGG